MISFSACNKPKSSDTVNLVYRQAGSKTEESMRENSKKHKRFTLIFQSCPVFQGIFEKLKERLMSVV